MITAAEASAYTLDSISADKEMVFDGFLQASRL